MGGDRLNKGEVARTDSDPTNKKRVSGYSGERPDNGVPAKGKPAEPGRLIELKPLSSYKSTSFQFQCVIVEAYSPVAS
jgi:hypothetical protein